MDVIYLDNAATTPPRPEALDAMTVAMAATWGNPSSTHSVGRAARALVDTAREQVASALHCAFSEVVFTSGGTEADNLALRGVIARWKERGRHVIVSAIEHDAVLTTAETLADSGQCDLTVVGCDASGRVNVEEIRAALRDDTILVSVMLANNEVGTIQPVAELADIVHAANPHCIVHTDAVQAFGKIGCSPKDLGVDLMSVSAHKIRGPKGAGALYIRDGIFLSATNSGGGHEHNRRSGTENVPGIAGFGIAAQLAEAERPANAAQMARLATLLRERVSTLVEGVIVTGHEHRLAPFATFIVPDAPSQLVITALDQKGVAVSGGSACSSGAPAPSHVLLAMGYAPHLSRCGLRCVVGARTTDDAVHEAAEAIASAVQAVRSSTAASASRPAHAPLSTSS